MIVREYISQDLPEIVRIWNEVVEDGIAFPQEETLNIESGAEFFASQSYTGVAEEDGKISQYNFLPRWFALFTIIRTKSFRVTVTVIKYYFHQNRILREGRFCCVLR